MKRHIILCFFLLQVVFLLSQNRLSVKDIILNDSNTIYYQEINDSVCNINVTIDGIQGSKTILYVNDNDDGFYIPKYKGKYKKSFILKTGYHQHYRLISIFEARDNIIIYNEYENSIAYTYPKKEINLFIYNGKLIAFVEKEHKSFFKQIHKSIITKEIDTFEIHKKCADIIFKDGSSLRVKFPWYIRSF